MHQSVRKRTEGFQWTLVVLTALFLGLSLIQAPYPKEQWLQHIPTLLALVLMSLSIRWGWLSSGSLACVSVFVWLHIFGARWTYSNLPYDEWASHWLGSSISDRFGWDRNHYDRLVHFCFGLLGVAPAAEMAARRGKMSLGWSLLFAIGFVMTVSALYEVLEWLITIWFAPEQAEVYNGQQGDIWDPQKDMALAFAGAVIVAAGQYAMARWRSRRPGEATAVPR